MKIKLQILKLAAIVLLISLSSCTYRENVYINEDGSGKFSIEMDGSSLMSMVPAESFQDATKKAIDSTITFKSLFENKKDSISKLPAEEQQKIKEIENYVMHIKMNPEQKQLRFDVSTEFSDINKFQSDRSKIKDVQKTLNPKQMGDMPFADLLGNNSMCYALSKKKFSRKTIINKDKASEKSTQNDSLFNSMKMILDQSTYVVNYHFPKKVKKISNPNAKISEDGKTITIEYPFSESMSDPSKLDFEVTFKK